MSGVNAYSIQVQNQVLPAMSEGLEILLRFIAINLLLLFFFTIFHDTYMCCCNL